jgi:hypothetical protein
MPKMIVSIDAVVIREVQLTKDKTTLGRRPYNDIVIDNRSVSGEHALIYMSGTEVVLEDLNSTNGSYVNGKPIKKQALQNGDAIEVGKYKIQFVADSTPPVMGAPDAATGPSATIKVLSGAAAGREVPLTKVVTTIGKPAVAVAAITKRHHGFVVHHVEGGGNPTLNGIPITSEPLSLKSGDVIQLAGTQMQFVQS